MLINYKNLLAVLCILFLPVSIVAQIMSAGDPVVIPRLRTVSADDKNTLYILPKFDIDKEKDNANSLLLSERRFAFGKSFDVSLSPNNSGEWFHLPNGDTCWELEIYSENAYSINLIFSSFHLPEGAKMYIFNADRSHIIGAFTSLNNKPTGILPTLPVSGDKIVVQYVQPKNVAFSGTFVISTITHDFVNVFAALRTGYFDDAAACEFNVACYEKYNEIKQSVVKIIIGGAELCSGALINNARNDGTPYVLTARHCMLRDTSGYKTIFIFNYESPLCLSNIEGTRSQSLAGAQTVALSLGADSLDMDFALLKASVDIPSIYQPYFAGWDIASTAPTSTFVIHHPVGDVKKVSWDDNSPFSTTLIIDNQRYFQNAHYRVLRWEGGVTEGGSSGSPLFNQDSKIIGALSAGASTCLRPGNDYFYKMSYAWNSWGDSFRQLKHWLDPNNSGVFSLDGFEPKEASAIKRFSNVVASDSLGVIYNSGVLSSASNQVDAIAEHFDISSGKLLGFYFVPYKGWVSQSSPINIDIWSGKTQPDELLHTQQLSLSEWGRTQTVSAENYGEIGGFVTVDKLYNSSSKKQCFVMLSEPVSVKDGFFISFSWEQPIDTFALLQTIKRNDLSVASAWKLDGSGWMQVSNSEIDNSAVSFFVDALLTDVGKDVGVVVNRIFDVTLKYDTESAILSVVGDDSAFYDGVASLYDMRGNLLKAVDLTSQNDNNISDLLPFIKGSGVYIVNVSSSLITRSFKVNQQLLVSTGTNAVIYLQ